MKEHVYLPFAHVKDCSEAYQIQQAYHFTNKISGEVFRKTPAEKQELKDRMQAYPNKNHCPVPPNR